MARAGHIRNWNHHRVDRGSGLLFLAAARSATCQSGLASMRELFMDACKIKETANGSRRCACGEARQAFQVVAQRGLARDVQIDEQSGAAQNGEDEAQGEADKQAQEEVELPWPFYRSRGRGGCRSKETAPIIVRLERGRTTKCPRRAALRPRRVGTASFILPA
jgi:hypothetical protein